MPGLQNKVAVVPGAGSGIGKTISEVFEKLSRAKPIGRMGQPEDVTALARFLCSDEATFVTEINFPLDGETLNLSM